MLTQTIRRLEGLVSVDRIFVITNAEQRESVLETCPGCYPNVIGEPVGRYSRRSGIGALLVKNEGDDASFALLPADHVIQDSAGFQATLLTAFEAERQKTNLSP